MLYSDSCFLLGTNIEVILITDETNTPSVLPFIFDYFKSFEKEFSRFLPNSTLSQLNLQKTLQVSHRCIDLVRQSFEQFQKTDGFFNPLIQPGSVGYTHSFEENNFEIGDTEMDLDMKKIQIQGNHITLGSQQKLDFGGIGKGYAVDRAADILRIWGYDNFCINAGGDIVTRGLNASGNLWTVGIENPFLGIIDTSFSLTNKAIATSGRYKRKWNIGEQEHHHLINPFTRENDHNIMSVTLIADRCIDADCFTKKIFHQDEKSGISSMEKNHIDGLIVNHTGEVYVTSGLLEKYGYIPKNILPS